MRKRDSCNLVHNPEVLFLDEPTTGVDPLSRRQFWDILKKLRDDGVTIIVSTPYMDEVSFADHTLFIHEGSKLAEGTPEQLTDLFRGQAYRINIPATAELMKRLSRIDRLSSRRFGSAIHLYLDDTDAIENFHPQLSQAGIDPDKIVKIRPDLEDTFIQLMGS